MQLSDEKPDPSTLLEMGRSVLAEQPLSVWIGTQVNSFTEGAIELEVAVREDLTQQHGFVHGGVISYLADNAITMAGASMLGDSVTGEYKVNYLRPAVGDRLVARAQVARAGKRQAVAQCEIFAVSDGEEKLCAVALGTANKIAP